MELAWTNRKRVRWHLPHNLRSPSYQRLMQLSPYASIRGVCYVKLIPNRALSIPANGVFQNLVVVERAVAEGVVDSVSSKVRPKFSPPNDLPHLTHKTPTNFRS